MTQLPHLDEFFSKSQAARFLTVSTRTLDRRHAEGIGPPRIKHGNKIGYFRSSLVRWLKGFETDPVRC
jgi:hypothetical protein